MAGRKPTISFCGVCRARSGIIQRFAYWSVTSNLELSHKWPLSMFNTLRLRQNGRHFADDIFKCIFLNENIWISINISLKFVPQGPIDKIPSLVQIMAWRRPGDKPLSEPMMVSLLMHICITRPQWVNPLVAVRFERNLLSDFKKSFKWLMAGFFLLWNCCQVNETAP